MPRGLTVFGDRSIQVTGRSWSRKLIPDSQGALVDNLIIDGETYRRYVWENSGQLIPQAEETDVDVLIIGGGGGGGAPHGSEAKDGGSGGGGGCNENNGGLSIADTGVGYAGGYGPVNWSNSDSAGGGAGSRGDTPLGYLDHPGNGGEGVDMSYAFGDDYGQSGLFAGGGAGGTEGNDGATNNSDYLRPIGKAWGGDGGRIEYDGGDSYN